MMKIGINDDKVIAPIKKLINKIELHYYTIDELNEINLLIAKLIKFSEKVKDQNDINKNRRI